AVEQRLAGHDGAADDPPLRLRQGPPGPGGNRRRRPSDKPHVLAGHRFGHADVHRRDDDGLGLFRSRDIAQDPIDHGAREEPYNRRKDKHKDESSSHQALRDYQFSKVMLAVCWRTSGCGSIQSRFGTTVLKFIETVAVTRESWPHTP